MVLFLAEPNGSPEETEVLDFPCWLCPSQHSDLDSWRKHIIEVHKLPPVFRFVSLFLALCLSISCLSACLPVCLPPPKTVYSSLTIYISTYSSPHPSVYLLTPIVLYTIYIFCIYLYISYINPVILIYLSSSY